jgi:hypothetical protein
MEEIKMPRAIYSLEAVARRICAENQDRWPTMSDLAVQPIQGVSYDKHID